MTVLVGVLCQDGVVIGADSVATMGMRGQFTIKHEPVTKISLIGRKVILAGTGAIGLNQRFERVLERAVQNSVFDVPKAGSAKSGVDVARDLAADLVKDFGSTAVERGQYGALVAFELGGTPYLVEYDAQTLQPELKTKEMWYVSMGCGQLIADPFLGFIRIVFWNNGLPKVEDAKFAVAWALHQTIELNTGGVGGKERMAVLQKPKTGKPYEPQMLDEDALAEHQGNVQGAIEHLRRYRDIMQGKTGQQEDIPKAPAL